MGLGGKGGGWVAAGLGERFAKGLKNCRVVQLSSGIHYLQEDHPEVIGAAVSEWLIDLGIGSSPKHKVASWAFPLMLGNKRRITDGQSKDLPAGRSYRPTRIHG